VELVGMVKHFQRPRRIDVLVHVDDCGHLVRASPVHMVLPQSRDKCCHSDVRKWYNSTGLLHTQI